MQCEYEVLVRSYLTSLDCSTSLRSSISSAGVRQWKNKPMVYEPGGTNTDVRQKFEVALRMIQYWLI